MGSALDNIFNSYAGGSIFKNKSVLQINYTPETIPHRTSQIESVASILAPALKGERVSNLFMEKPEAERPFLSSMLLRRF